MILPQTAHRLNYTTTKIQTYKEDSALHPGTGFIAEYRGHFGLVTNWHILTGCDPDTNIQEKQTPDKLTCSITIANKIGFVNFKDTIKTKYNLEIPLTNNGSFTWHSFRDLAPQIDLGLVLLDDFLPEIPKGGGPVHITTEKGSRSIYQHGLISTSDDDNEFLARSYPQVGKDVYILGYPGFLEVGHGFPVWRKGSIASEPHIPIIRKGVETHNIVYVDAITRSGMSGAPVVRHAEEGEKFRTNSGEHVEIESQGIQFVGVYSGRDGIVPNRDETGIARVWKAELVTSLFRRALGWDVMRYDKE
jgi:hypothetical protein